MHEASIDVTKSRATRPRMSELYETTPRVTCPRCTSKPRKKSIPTSVNETSTALVKATMVKQLLPIILLVQLVLQPAVSFVIQRGEAHKLQYWKLRAFQEPTLAAESHRSKHGHDDSRRQFFSSFAGLVGLAASTCNPQPAQASYSAYTHREEDWKQRQEKGDIQYSSARSLKAQLQEIAPSNVSSRQLFCPNGATANVSPLMENRCGDKMALPSVYGRTEDTLGNSIPGFAGGFYDSGTGMLSGPGATDTGGLPSYGSFTSNVGGATRAR